MNRSVVRFILSGLLVAFVMAFGISRFASSEPDGLDKVATEKGFGSRERPHDLDDSPFAGYATSGVGDDGLGTGIAGIVGVVATFAVASGGAWAATKLRRRRTDSGDDRHTPARDGAAPPT